MPLNKFCETCKHLKVPSILKDKFNKLNYPLFVNHPIDDEKVVGCTVKYQEIEWNKFFKFLIQKKVLTKVEIEQLEKNGWSARNTK